MDMVYCNKHPLEVSAQSKMKKEYKKIVVIEPQETLRNAYEKLLKKRGYEALCATNGKEGLSLIRRELPALVLSEVLVPIMDGFRLLAHVHSMPSTRGIPFVLVTELGHPDDMQHGIRLGAHDYLIKGHHTPEQIVEKISAVLAS